VIGDRQTEAGMEIPQSAAETAKFLAPILPFLIEGGKAAARVKRARFPSLRCLRRHWKTR